jgi:hypothetical protein
MRIWPLGLGRVLRGPSLRRFNRKREARALSLEALEDRCLLSAGLWTQRGGDAGHTGYVDVSFDPATLGEAWYQSLGYSQSGTGSWYERAVAIDDAHVYRTALEGYAPVGTYHVLAYDLDTGDQAWHRTFIGNAFEGVGEPSVAGGIVYVNRAGHSGISGGTDADLPRIYGLDADTGATVLERRYEAQWGSNERPVIDANQLVVEDGYYGGISAYTASTLTRQWFVGRSAAYNPPFAALDDQYAYAFGNEVYRRSDGVRLPNITHPDGLSTVTAPMTSPSGQVFFTVSGYVNGAYAYGVSAFDGDTHAHLWTTYTPTPPAAKAVGNGVVAVAAGPNLLLLDEADGSQIQSWQAPANLTGEIVLTQSHVFVESASSGVARVHAIDLSTGGEVWTFENRVSGSAVMEMALGGGHLLLSHHLFVRAFAVGAANRPPDAVDDSRTTDEDTPLTINVLANDTDPDGDALTVTALGGAAHGSLTLNPDGTITYSPSANYHGGDSFTYTIDDGRGGEDTATVSLTVNAVNDDPQVNDAVFSLQENSDVGTLVGTIEASDVDGDSLTFSLSGADAAAFAIDPQTGTLSVTDAALLDFETHPRFEFLVHVSDGVGGQATANVRIDLTDVLVEIDVLPDDPNNELTLDTRKFQVAILASATFDPLAMLDLSTIRLRANDSVAGAEPLSHPKKGYNYDLLDVNGDGLLDLVLTFKTSATGLQAGDTSLRLEGNLKPEFGGDFFSVAQAITLLEGDTKGGGKGKSR